MKPLDKCPSCLGPMIDGKDDLSRWRCCAQYHLKNGNCKFEAFERYMIDATDVSYINFYFEKYFATVYFNAYGYEPNTAMIYSVDEIKETGRATPIVYVNNFVPDFSDLKALENRLAVMVVFS